jgi:hypothetical protein
MQALIDQMNEARKDARKKEYEEICAIGWRKYWLTSFIEYLEKGVFDDFRDKLHGHTAVIFKIDDGRCHLCYELFPERIISEPFNAAEIAVNVDDKEEMILILKTELNK